MICASSSLPLSHVEGNVFFQRWPRVNAQCDSALFKYQRITTYQTHKDAEKLHNISVGHGVESSNEGVEDGNQSRDHHRHVDVDVYDHAQGGTCGVTQARGSHCTKAISAAYCGEESRT